MMSVIKGFWGTSFSPLGLDLGSSHIKLVQFKRETKGARLYRYGIYPYPGRNIKKGRISDSETLAGHLKKIVEELGIKKKDVNISINSQSIFLRTLNLPIMPSKEISAAVKWEMERQLSIPAEEFITDYIFDRERIVNGEQVLEILSVAVYREVVAEYIEVVSKAGLNPVKVEIEPLSLSRIFRLYSPPTQFSPHDPLIVLVDIGGEYSNLLVMEGGAYVYSRTLGSGINHLCRHVAEINQIEYSTASSLIVGENPFTLPGFQEIAADLVELIRRSLEYFVQRIQDNEVDFKSIVLCGGGANVKGLDHFIAESLTLESQLLSPFGLLDSRDNMENNHTPAEDSSRLCTAGGLALRGWKAV